MRFGDHDVRVQESSQVDLVPSEFLVYPQYNHMERDYDHDIALIRFKKPVVINESVRPICLPSLGDKNNYYCSTFGDPSTTFF